MIAGSQTQPAVLAYANDTTGFDQRVALGYALVYPVAMVAKIVVCQILTMT
jgi:putative transport protein